MWLWVGNAITLAWFWWAYKAYQNPQLRLRFWSTTLAAGICFWIGARFGLAGAGNAINAGPVFGAFGAIIGFLLASQFGQKSNIPGDKPPHDELFSFLQSYIAALGYQPTAKGVDFLRQQAVNQTHSPVFSATIVVINAICHDLEALPKSEVPLIDSLGASQLISKAITIIQGSVDVSEAGISMNEKEKSAFSALVEELINGPDIQFHSVLLYGRLGVEITHDI